MKVPSLRHEVDRITEAQQLPILLIMIAFWIVCAVEWTQRLFGTIPDPRFWSLIAFVFTAYGGVQIFRLNRARQMAQRPDPRSKALQALRQLFADGSGSFHNLKSVAAGIDNVLVSGTGVYAVQIKHRPGAGTIECGQDGEIVFGGRLRDGRLLQNAARASEPVQALLATCCAKPPVVRPLVVLIGDWKIEPGPAFPGVDFISVDDLPNYFYRRAAALNSDEVGQISACLSSLAA